MAKQTQLDIKAHAEMLPLEASGLVGGEHVVLMVPGSDNLSVRIKRVPNGPFNFLQPGMRCIVTLGIVAINVVEVPEGLPGLPSGGLIKGNN